MHLICIADYKHQQSSSVPSPAESKEIRDTKPQLLDRVIFVKLSKVLKHSDADCLLGTPWLTLVFCRPSTRDCLTKT
jgi:hypothetical protein